MDKLVTLLQHLRGKFFPRLAVRFREREAQCLLYGHGAWELVAMAERPERGLFGQEYMLMPDHLSLFRYREYPGDHIKRTELAEAVQLDIANWSPWEEACHFCFWPVQAESNWQVAVWVWPAKAEKELAETTHISPTHVLPEFAWRLSMTAGDNLPAIFISREQDSLARIAILGQSGIPLQVSECTDPAAEQRLWNSLEEDVRDWRRLDDPQPQALPAARALLHARQEGIKDWTDPFSWIRPASALFGLYLFWLLGSGLVLWQKLDEVNALATTAQSAAIEVVEQRERVTEALATLTELSRLRQRQTQFEETLAVLSRNLPRDAWVEAMQYSLEDGGTIDIDGKAQRSAGLAALLESLPEVEHAAFIGDIRREKGSGMEPFKIRLKLVGVTEDEI